MATITSLFRSNPLANIQVEGNLVTGSEQWCLIVDTANTSDVSARVLVSALGTNNAFGWMVVGISPHPDDPSLYITGFDIEREELKTDQFTITTSMTNEIQSINNSKKAVDADPIFDYPEVDTMVEIDIDPITGKAIASSDGRAFYPKVQRKGTDTRIVVTRNDLVYDPRKARQYRNKLNKDTVIVDGRAYDPRVLLLESWTGKSAIDTDGSEYYQVKYQLLYDPDGHQFEQIDASVGPDKNGDHPKINGETRPWKLNGAGVFLGKAQQEDPESFETLSFYAHPEIDMNSVLRLQ